MQYTLNELMVVAAAREIKDGEVVFVGMRLPLICVCGGQEDARTQRHRAFLKTG